MIFVGDGEIVFNSTILDLHVKGEHLTSFKVFVIFFTLQIFNEKYLYFEGVLNDAT